MAAEDWEMGAGGRGFIDVSTKWAKDLAQAADPYIHINQFTVHLTTGPMVFRRKPIPIPEPCTPAEVTINGQRYIKAP